MPVYPGALRPRTPHRAAPSRSIPNPNHGAPAGARRCRGGGRRPGTHHGIRPSRGMEGTGRRRMRPPHARSWRHARRCRTGVLWRGGPGTLTVTYRSASGVIIGAPGCPPECTAGCRACDSIDDPETEAARRSVRGWFRERVLLSLQAVKPATKAKPKPKPTPFNGALRRSSHGPA